MTEGAAEIVAALGGTASERATALGLPAAARTGSYNDLDDKPSIPSAATVSDHEDRIAALESAPGGSEAFPVGSIFLSAVSTDPATLLGYGTWSAIGAGRVLVGQDSGDSDFDTLGETGGAKTVTLTEAQIPAHTHAQRRHATSTGQLSGWTTAVDASSSNPQDAGPVTGSTGGGGSHPNVQPYLVVKMWERTA